MFNMNINDFIIHKLLDQFIRRAQSAFPSLTSSKEGRPV